MNLRPTEWLVANHYIPIYEPSADWSAKCDDYIYWLQISKFTLMNLQPTVQLNVVTDWLVANHKFHIDESSADLSAECDDLMVGCKSLYSH